jgi:hypothetical protein
MEAQREGILAASVQAQGTVTKVQDVWMDELEHSILPSPLTNKALSGTKELKTEDRKKV